MSKKNISVYIHIPFCSKKCGYCDFITFACSSKYYEPYKNSLIKEITSFKKLQDYNIISIFVGGGTPTVFPEDFLAEIFTALSIYNIDKNVEITVEANPGTLSLNKLRTLKNSGVNRLSIGLQAWQNKVLKKIDRNHTIEEFLKNYDNARRIGFENINVDLIFSLPYMKNEEIAFKLWYESIREITKLNPEHLSIYSLILEEKTLFFYEYEKGNLKIQSQESDRRMYHFAIKYLQKKGYKHYEIANFSKGNRECIHNKVYWKRGEYIGFGLGAASFINNERQTNIKSLIEYNKKLASQNYKREDILLEKDIIDKKEAMEEFIYLGLRCTQGVNAKDFKQIFGENMWDIFRNPIQKNIHNNLLEKRDDVLKLTQKGLDISNIVFSDFI